MSWLPASALAAANPFFARQAISNHNLKPFTKWTEVLSRYEQQAGSNSDGQEWETLLSGLQGKPAQEKLRAVNSFFNKAPYKDDRVNFGSDDYWQTPYELMSQGGDCEDYAIAKYISLKRLGISESSMRIFIVQDSNLGGIMHAVLEVNVNGTRYLLDNQAQSVIPVAKVFHYRPIYAINESAWWNFV